MKNNILGSFYPERLQCICVNGALWVLCDCRSEHGVTPKEEELGTMLIDVLYRDGSIQYMTTFAQEAWGRCNCENIQIVGWRINTFYKIAGGFDPDLQLVANCGWIETKKRTPKLEDADPHETVIVWDKRTGDFKSVIWNCLGLAGGAALGETYDYWMHSPKAPKV